jgi:FMN-dependent NADH-azoreductase
LYIKANAKPEGQSRTFKISDNFIDEYKKSNPNDEVIILDLYKEGISFLTEEGIGKHAPNPGEGRNDPVLKYAYQFVEADKFVIAAPFWNLSIPAILKAYVDYICVAGITFKYTAEGPAGLCQGKKVVHIVSRGGGYSGEAEAYEMGDRYLRTILGFLGITEFTTIAADNLDIMGQDVEGIIQSKIKEAQEKARNF